MQINPYINFDGRCAEAIEFYKKKLGIEVVNIMYNKDNPDANRPDCPPSDPNMVMHVSFRIGDALLMASDCHGKGNPAFVGMSLAVNTRDPEQAKRLFEGLTDGGSIQMPLTKTFFSPLFGVVTDRFGVNWMVHVEA